MFEHYGKGEDERLGAPLGRVAFGPDVLHDLRSVSKSVVGLAYGIALAEGKVPPPEAKLYAQFPEYADLAAQPGRDSLTIDHVLSMTLGIEWDELRSPTAICATARTRWRPRPTAIATSSNVRSSASPA